MNIVGWLENVSWLKGAILVVGGFLAGNFANDFLDYRSRSREITAASVNEAISSSQEIDPILQKFANVARGTGVVDDADRDQLSTVIKKLYNTGRVAAARIPQAESAFKQYAEALVELQRAADKLQSPLDGKRFVEAMSRFLLTREQFTSATINNQNTFFGLLARL